MFSLAFNLIFDSQVIKICLGSTFVVAFMLVHCSFYLSARVEFKFEFEFNRLSGVEIEIDKERRRN